MPTGSRQRFHSVMAAPALFEADASAVLVAFGDKSRGDFEAADLDQAKRLAGHFGAALRFRFAQERTAAELDAANFVLDELPDAIFLVSRRVFFGMPTPRGGRCSRRGRRCVRVKVALSFTHRHSPSGSSAYCSRRAASFARRSRVADPGSFSSTSARGGSGRSRATS
jgi:hypothetical protein